MKAIYFDHNASTPLESEVISKMKSVLENNFGNPSSSHIYGLKSKQIIEEARDSLAKMLNADAEEIIFTSGGSESNNMAIRGIVKQFPKCHIITSVIEHPSVQKVCDALELDGFRVTSVKVDHTGIIDIDDFKNQICDDTKLISIMLANNETGVLQPIKKIAEIAKKHKILIHTDAAQAAGKIKIDVNELNVDLLTIAAHKMYGPKGVGALYIRRGVKINPLILGAGHEGGLRAGTENVLEIAGLGVAAQIFIDNSNEIINHQKELRDRFFEQIYKYIPSVKLNSDVENRLPNTANLYFPDCNANKILSEIPEIAASAGAACHADSIEPSQVLTAMGFTGERALGSIRFSFGRTNTSEEIDFAVEKIVKVVNELQKSISNEHISDEKSITTLSLANSSLGCSCKLSPKNLNDVLKNITNPLNIDNNSGFENSDDAGVYFLDDKTAILSTIDFIAPIVENPFDFGRIATANALSDIYAMGGKPLFANNIVVFPEDKLPKEILVEILKGAQSVTDLAGVQILGGHSVKDNEIKYGMSVTGIVNRENLLKNNGAETGDILILTKAIGVGVLCMAMKKRLLQTKTIKKIIDKMANLNKDISEILNDFMVTACTDISGFGLLGHLSEMMEGSGKSAILYQQEIPIFEDVEKIVRLGIVSDGYFGNVDYFDKNIEWCNDISPSTKKIFFDPQTSGGLLFSIKAQDTEDILKIFHEKNINDIYKIGKIIDKKEKLIYIQ